ncbi:MAG: S9 family peptidase [Actinobacteria bacterium]|nr:S9 family peptidase [Actinomycetota bacterium]
MPGMRPEGVYELTGAADPRISPDGTRVAYVVWWIDGDANAYRSAIWTAPIDGSSEPTRFTSGEKRDGTPRWSPDGKWLAFVSNRGSDDKTPGNIYVIPAEGGEARKLTDLKESAEKMAWSPDSTRIAFSSRVRDEAYDEEDDRKRKPRRLTRLFYKLDSVGWTTDRRTHLFVVDVDGESEARQITDGDSEDGEPCWTPDGTRIVFPSLRGERWDIDLVGRLYSVDANGGKPQQLTGDGVTFDTPAFSPDGSMLAARYQLEDGTFPHHGQIAVMNPDGSDLRLLTASLDRQCTPYPEFREPVWDDGRIVFSLEEGGNVHVYAVAADGSSAPELLLGGERVMSAYDVREGTVVYTATTHTTLRELYVDDRRVTNLTGERTYCEAERFTAISKDGTEVDAWLVRPDGFEAEKKYPVLLNVHGGPFSQYGTGFFDEFQVYAGAGYAVLFSNPRGGSGYSEEWSRAIRGPIEGGPGWGTVDYEDVLGVVDTALETFEFLDGDRLGIIGGSYGGFMTSWTISHDNRFKAAVSERAVNEMGSAFGSSDLFWVFEQQFGGQWYDYRDEWLDRSPATYAKNIETPVLVLHSENDLRCNIEQGEHLFTMLRLMGKEVEMLRFPAESHELTRSGSPLHRVQRFEAVLEWFDRYLKP